MNWMYVLKSDQVSIGSTTLDTRELPEGEDDDNNCKDRWFDFIEDLTRELKNKFIGFNYYDWGEVVPSKNRDTMNEKYSFKGDFKYREGDGNHSYHWWNWYVNENVKPQKTPMNTRFGGEITISISCSNGQPDESFCKLLRQGFGDWDKYSKFDNYLSAKNTRDIFDSNTETNMLAYIMVSGMSNFSPERAKIFAEEFYETVGLVCDRHGIPEGNR